MKQFLLENQDYDFMLQDSAHTTNSGFLIIKHTQYSINILKQWVANLELCTAPWEGDQFCLGITMLQHAYQFRSIPYDDECCFYTQGAHGANLCYKRHMEHLGFPVNYREFEKILMIDHNTRFNMHDSGDSYRKGDIFYHGHSEDMCI